MNWSTSQKKSLLFPLLANYNMTRLILSYLPTFELETTVSRINKWAYKFIKETTYLSLIYNRKDLRITHLTPERVLNEYNIANKKIIRSTQIIEISEKYSKFTSIETNDNRIFVIGGYNDILHKIVSFVYMITPNHATKEIDTTHYERLAFGLVIVGNELMMIGGFNEGTLKICEKMNLKSLKWSSVPAMNMKRCSPILSSFNNNTVYIFGGSDGYSALNSVERLIENNNSWEMLPDFCSFNNPQLRVDGMAKQISLNELIIFGGYLIPQKSPMMISLIYNVRKGKITGKISMKSSEVTVNMGVHMEHELLYAIGTKVHVFNCKTKTWNTIESIQ